MADSIVTINALIANGANATIIAAVANKTVFIHDVFVAISLGAGNGGATAMLTDTNNNEIAHFGNNSSGATSDASGPDMWGHMSGVPLATGVGLKIANVTGGGNANNHIGYVTYSQR